MSDWLQDGTTVLFIGDSITDCGRRDVEAPLGNGYVRTFTELVTARWPERRIEWINKGISGNRVSDLHGRWRDDVLSHRPDRLSVKIGINDLHSSLGGAPDAVPPERFEALYDEILDLTARELGCPVVLISPFYISLNEGRRPLPGPGARPSSAVHRGGGAHEPEVRHPPRASPRRLPGAAALPGGRDLLPRAGAPEPRRPHRHRPGPARDPGELTGVLAVVRITDIHIHQPCGLLRLRTDTELEGWCPGVDESSAGHILRSCRDTLVGADPMERERLWNELVRLDRFAYLPHSVRGFLDVALWDLAAKACGVPVFRLIGGFRDRLPAYKMGPNLPAVGDFVEAAVTARDEGFFGYKDHCYHGPETMIEVARQARRAVGPDFHLMHDAVQTYTYPRCLACRAGRWRRRATSGSRSPCATVT